MVSWHISYDFVLSKICFFFLHRNLFLADFTRPAKTPLSQLTFSFRMLLNEIIFMDEYGKAVCFLLVLHKKIMSPKEFSSLWYMQQHCARQ